MVTRGSSQQHTYEDLVRDSRSGSVTNQNKLKQTKVPKAEKIISINIQ